jgi:C1A family cysteine protease
MKLTKSRINRRYGWRRNQLPNFALRNEFRGDPALVLPPKFDLLAFQSQPFDQGQEGSCTANSACGALRELHHVMGVPPDQDFSRQFLYYMERKDDGSGARNDAGSSIAESVHALETYGAPLEAHWPYTPANFAKKPSKLALTEALHFRTTGNQLVAQTLTAFKQTIMAQRSVLIGFTVFESFESDHMASTGLMPMPQKGEQVLGGHAVRKIGWDDTKQMPGGLVGAFLVRNSWGPLWGDHGDFWMPYAFALSRECSDFHSLGKPI